MYVCMYVNYAMYACSQYLHTYMRRMYHHRRPGPQSALLGAFDVGSRCARLDHVFYKDS